MASVFVAGLVTAPPSVALAEPNALHAGERLSSGEQLVSPNGTLRLIMQSDGNLVLYTPTWNVRWQSRTDGNPGAFAQMQADGNFVVYSAAAVPLWHSGTYGSGTVAVYLQDDGNLVTYTAQGVATWQSGSRYFPARIDSVAGLSIGQGLQSPNGAYVALMQSDGNFVVYQGSTATWNSQTAGSGANRLVLQSDGNLVLYTAANAAVWNTRTDGRGASFLQMQDDGNLVLYTAAAQPTWFTAQYTAQKSPAERAVEYAKLQVGKPYVWGAEGEATFDCSGLTKAAWIQGGYTLTHQSQKQYNEGAKYPLSQRQPGDLIFYYESVPSKITHVAIYIGEDRIVHAAGPNSGVKISSYNYTTHIIGQVVRPTG